MARYKFTPRADAAIYQASHMARTERREYCTPEMLLLAIAHQAPFLEVLHFRLVDAELFTHDLQEYINSVDVIPEKEIYELEPSFQFHVMLRLAEYTASNTGYDAIDIPHIISAILKLENSLAAFTLRKYLSKDVEYDLFIMELISNAYGFNNHDEEEDEEEEPEEHYREKNSPADDENETTRWHTLVTCMNEICRHHNPLIGREKEMDRAIQVLCRKDKNNPLFVGESGVGKTALVYGLAAKIENREVPEPLRKCKIYAMDMGQLVAGAQFRGEFEKRMKLILDGAIREGNCIIYIDEIHCMMGAGQTGEGALDGSGILKRYLEEGRVRFIGSTTYQEFNRYIAKDKAFVRRFRQIDVPEPTVGETLKIINGLIDTYIKFHKVTYKSDAIEYAVEKSAQLITDRFLPDKAIDIIDEAGAYRSTHPLLNKKGERKPTRYQIVDTPLVANILSGVCKIDAKALTDPDNTLLEKLNEHICASIFGQDDAVRRVTEAILMAKAGLNEPNKPLASLLFVGPTGVGKTELCRVLAQELGIALVRFDMSEYTEKHTVAKLIGSPAGYIGYEDGGLLTDAIRKSPNCVLLLDEIEKAHKDIYNIMLQVMDYACLTDNRGNKADFSNVVLIMTSNAGARDALNPSLGFKRATSGGEVMLQSVSKTFMPEFLNRLTATVVFNDMNRDMAENILNKKLEQLSKRLSARKITMELTPEAHQLLLERGFSTKYGAREVDRVIQSSLKPLLMHEILFGKLKNGGHVSVRCRSEELSLHCTP
jgi:ATP-dependent Clp protease ATP-binding subunit ClpA